MDLPHQRHTVDSAMAAFAAHSLGNVDAVIEVHKIRQIVHAAPCERLVGVLTFSNGGQQGAIPPYLRMASHADFRCREAGKTGDFHGGVTISTIDPESAYVMVVTERNRLIPDDVRVRHIGRT